MIGKLPREDIEDALPRYLRSRINTDGPGQYSVPENGCEQVQLVLHQTNSTCNHNCIVMGLLRPPLSGHILRSGEDGLSSNRHSCREVVLHGEAAKETVPSSEGLMVSRKVVEGHRNVNQAEISEADSISLERVELILARNSRLDREKAQLQREEAEAHQTRKKKVWTDALKVSAAQAAARGRGIRKNTDVSRVFSKGKPLKLNQTDSEKPNTQSLNTAAPCGPCSDKRIQCTCLNVSSR